MANFVQRMIGAATLDVATYEEVEHDRGATGQAMAVVVLSGIAAGIALWHGAPRAFIGTVIGDLIGWVIWAVLTYFIGAKLLPERQTEADVSELLRTLGFAASPGILRVFGIIPFLGPIFLLVTSIWMLVTMIIAVRQALDYTSTLRAIGVAIIGWIVYLIIFVVLFRPLATMPLS